VLAPEDQPWLENYHDLWDWINKHKGICMWQTTYGPPERPSARVEVWRVGHGRLCLIVVHSGRRGWEIYTPTEGVTHEEIFADAEKKLGIAPQIKDQKEEL